MSNRVGTKKVETYGTREDPVSWMELDLLLQAVRCRYGYDFRQYTEGMLKRRISKLVLRYRLNHISELIPLVIHDHQVFNQLLHNLSITVSEFFRDPDFFLTVRRNLIPVFRTYPFISVWVAGCAAGEEAYGWAIVLAEEGLIERSRIYATDINEGALAEAREGIFDEDHYLTGSRNYRDSGGRYEFSDYCQRSYGAMKIADSLQDHITFANHNLVQDGVFGEMVVISCRNVMIYFNAVLKERCMTLFGNSLSHRGFLCLGNRESLSSGKTVADFEVWNKKYRIYRKRDCQNPMESTSVSGAHEDERKS